ncbi:cytochrome P450 [Nocardia vinacea]|uniref:cytochrome P450 n=1 Tax=Nocardia vinacea TaxID=96468 RepID=UPI0002EDEAD5|nr:cytochrome P450 [Nocardia vinacea]
MTLRADPQTTTDQRMIPCAPAGLPLFGHALPVLRDPFTFLNSLAALDNGLVQVRLGPLAVVVVCDPDLSNQVLRDDRTFDKGGPLFISGRRVIGNNLVTCPHGQHRRQRRLVQPTFHRHRLPSYAQAMSDQVEAVVGRWTDGQILDVPVEMSEITTRVVMKTLFSGELGPTDMQLALHAVPIIADGILARTVRPAVLDRVPTPGNRRYRKAGANLRAMLDTYVAKRRAEEGVEHGDLLSTLVTTRDTDGRGLSDAEISDQVVIFFIAGSETTANAVAWALYFLADHPDIEERLHAEVDRVLPDGGTASLDRLPELTFTGQIIAEVLRLYPPVWMLTRTVTADTELGGYSLSRGTTVIYSPYLIHHRSDQYQNPELFDPDRWSDDQTPIRREAYIPFGAGARKCIGDTFGLTEATLALATIAARWRLRPIPGIDPRPVIGTVLRARDLRMRLIVRH